MRIFYVSKVESDEIVFNTPEDLAEFYELIVEKGQNVIVVEVVNGKETGQIIYPDIGTAITSKTLVLRSEN